ncbi:hypothetical protein LXL04_017885 [Taraxacum kok-saghyz]
MAPEAIHYHTVSKRRSNVLGIISLVCWGVAEIPQIITNFRSKSSHGVSLIFLLTWIVGDIFNLVGRLLEPATLPTQYYTTLVWCVSSTQKIRKNSFGSLMIEHRRAYNYEIMMSKVKTPLNDLMFLPITHLATDCIDELDARSLNKKLVLHKLA